MKLLRAAILLALAAMPMHAAAAVAAPASAKDDPAKTAVALDILDATRAKQNALAMLDVMLPPMLESIKTAAPNLPVPVLEKFRTLARARMAADIPKFMRMQAGIWAQHYSLGELRQLAAFYRSPLGQRVIFETPKIMKEMMPVGMAWGRSVGEQAMSQAVQTLRKEGVKI